MRLALRRSAVALAVLLVATAPRAQRRSASFDLVQMDLSARTAALAGASGGLGGADATAAFSNPAFLTREMSRQLSLAAVNHLSDVNAGTILYARTVRGIDAAASVRYLSYGSFDRSAADGTTDGTTFGASEAAITLTAAQTVAPRVRVGGNVHALFATLDDARAQALAADVGATYEIPAQRLVFGASVNSIGTVLSSLGSVADTLRSDVRLSVAKRLQYIPLTLTVTGYDLLGGEGVASDSSAIVRAFDHVLVGGELALGRSLTARAGYSPRRGRALRGDGRLDLAGLSAGFGLTLRRFALDYAFSNWGETGALHQFGVRTRL